MRGGNQLKEQYHPTQSDDAYQGVIDMKFGVGQAALRKEDVRFLKGTGQYIDDIQPEGCLFCHVLRSSVAHADLTSLDATEARNAPGVRALYTWDDVADRLQPITCGLPIVAMGGPEIPPVSQPHVAKDRLRYVGQPIAFVVADTLDQARDAAEMIEFDFDELPVVVDAKAAVNDGAPLLHDEAPSNTCYDWTSGDVEQTEAAFAKAVHIATTPVRNQRIIVTSMEPRGIIVQYADDRWEAWVGSQGAVGMRNNMAISLKVEPSRLRVHAPDIGGGFGMKIMTHAEYGLAALAAKDTGKPIKWIGERSESFLSDVQARDLQTTAEGAFDAEGNLLGIRMRSFGNVGAYASTAGPAIHSVFSMNLTGGMYRVPTYAHRSTAAFTNTTPTDAYRGAGRPEVIHCTERLFEAAAIAMDMDPVEVRRKNLLTSADAPHTTMGGLTFDAQDPNRLIDEAMDFSDHAGFASRAEATTAKGKIRGQSAVYYMERTGGAPVEYSRVEISAEGKALIRVGTQSNGQGHETAWSQILTDNLGLEWDDITLAAGDSDSIPYGGGTGGSRSLIMASRVVKLAAEDVIKKTKPVAAEELEVAEADVEFSAADGVFSIAGTDRRVGLTEVIAKMGGVEGMGEVDTIANTFPNGCHVAEVEVDLETGEVTLDRYTMVDDFGTIVNPLIANGQAVGGLAQGAGQALMECAVYDEETGQPLTGSFMDYAMPRADNFPMIDAKFIEVPTPSNPYGVKGCGEAGTVAGIPAVTIAVRDAIRRAGGTPIEGPYTPLRVWEAINKKAA